MRAVRRRRPRRDRAIHTIAVQCCYYLYHYYYYFLYSPALIHFFSPVLFALPTIIIIICMLSSFAFCPCRGRVLSRIRRSSIVGSWERTACCGRREFTVNGFRLVSAICRTRTHLPGDGAGCLSYNTPVFCCVALVFSQ